MIHFNPILAQCDGAYFDKNGKCTINNAAGIKAMTIRTSFAKQWGAEDPADSIATNPLPGMDWLKERNSMFISHPLPLVAIKSQNQKMFDEKYFRAARAPGVVAGKGYTTTYGFNFVVSARAPKDKQEVLHDMYRFILSDAADCWADTAPFPLARKSGWADSAEVKAFPDIDEIIASRDRGVFHPRTVVFTELADAMHKAVQKILLSNMDIKTRIERGGGRSRPRLRRGEKGLRRSKTSNRAQGGHRDDRPYHRGRPCPGRPPQVVRPGRFPAAHPAMGHGAGAAGDAVLPGVQVRPDGVGGGLELHVL